MKALDSSNVRIIYHDLYATSYITASCEIPDRVLSIMKTMADYYEVIEPQPCTDDDILLCHSEGLLTVEKQDHERYDIACLAAGGAITAARLALEGYIPFAVIRPPGHHANPDHNWGFCFFNNMAIALKKLVYEKLITKAVVLDIDLHFGDGTDSMFKNDNNVTVINIQTSNPHDFIADTEHSLHNAGNADIIGISAGFDTYVHDWGGCLSTDDYYTIGKKAGAYASDKCHGRIFILLEGGYYIPDLGVNAHSLLQGTVDGLNTGRM